MHLKSTFIFAAIAMLGLVAPAGAQGPQPGQAPAPQQQGAVTFEQAIEIAKQNGVVSIGEVDRDDDEWEVEGRDAQGRKIEVEIDARTGQARVDR